MGSYQDHALDGASAVDLVVALYDGIIRFLYSAMDAVDRGDQDHRRIAVKRALDIIIHLQARLRMDIGGRPAQALSEFYASIFAQIMQASQLASRQKFEHTIKCVRDVRDAWKQVAQDVNVEGSAQTSIGSASRPQLNRGASGSGSDETVASRWTA
jgi:flagellar secretion chaperone FliS